MASDDVPLAETEMPLTGRLDVVLKPVSHAELGDIRIRTNLFAIGRAEPPFAQARAEVVAELSRRHAKIFVERGAAYIADLGSKNGTTINGVEVREKPSLLHEGDEIRFAGVLAYRVGFASCAQSGSPGDAGSIVLTLIPERSDLGLEPIVVTRFPFLVSKADETFARYRDAYPHQVNYVSRRHAHVFVEHDEAFVEDLGSTNGTFVDGVRLEERAVTLHDGARLAFGGNHFVYRVSIERDSAADRTVTKLFPPVAAGEQAGNQAPALPNADAAPLEETDRTTFIAAPHSFLDIFCVDPMREQEDEVNRETVPTRETPSREAQRPRGKVATFCDELGIAIGSGGTSSASDRRRVRHFVVIAVAVLCTFVAAYAFRSNPQRDIDALMAHGNFAAAAQLADGYLAQHPDDAAVKTPGAEALIKAMVPRWLAAIDAHAFDRAQAVAGQMKQLARHNSDAAPLVGEIGWIGELEAYWERRGGADAPIAIYRDEPIIKSLIARWSGDPDRHQRRLDQITSYVPAFGERYADSLSHLRQLESDDSVYVAALERLKNAIAAALDRAHPERLDALPALLDDYASRYPRLAAGLAPVRNDVSRYREILGDVRGGNAQAATDALNSARFFTPPFQAHGRELKELVAATQRSGK
ncbi:FHA domain-containing protein [Trinickia soli]|uniref:FHA domain-containing protein n=1 Tax=Trinickia soli TaxID=380675 RepID=A0A2N7VV61_9BURK|nr:FHA domain-containing protein [Trinickia soli]PMS21045.1 FHA domain-containing protein [Trinickia soli]CAB3666551.1 hypothetical protein LMG24076_01728 [Trinickia soli]